MVNRVAGQNQFILADSLGNTVRTNHPRVNEFIAILLGQEQAPLPKSAANILPEANTLQEKKNVQEALLESLPVVKEPQAATSENQSAISDQTAATEDQKPRSFENSDNNGNFMKKSFTECYTFVKNSWTAKIILSAIIIVIVCLLLKKQLSTDNKKKSNGPPPSPNGIPAASAASEKKPE